MAADAPNPANNVAGDLSTMIATITMPPNKENKYLQYLDKALHRPIFQLLLSTEYIQQHQQTTVESQQQSKNQCK